MAAVDGLLSEKCTFLDSNLALRAADEAYFGGRQVYTNVSPSTSRSHPRENDSEHGQGGSRGHGHKHARGKELVPKGDMHVMPKSDLHVAIQYAKDIVMKALTEASPSHGTVFDDSLHQEIKTLRKENEEIRKELEELRDAIEKFTRKQEGHIDDSAMKENSGDEDFDLFGSDDEDPEKAKIVEERLKAYHEKKSKKLLLSSHMFYCIVVNVIQIISVSNYCHDFKPGPIAKSSVILDVKPWDDDTNLKEMENLVRGIEMDGLVWGGSKFIPVGYGIKKLQIISVIEDDKVSVDDLVEKITGEFESHVQSVDIAAFNNI
uniref:Elongation factor 1-beta n=1 Tax=Angiostrongylus cantonensis TaxID=6313 RepID=A0A0K0CTM8_ANGCA